MSHEIDELVKEPIFKSQSVSPRMSVAEPRFISNTLLVKNGLLYDLYSLTMDKTGANGNFIKIEKLPGVLADGIVTFKRVTYLVSVQDLLRRRIDVRKRIATAQTTQRTYADTGLLPEFVGPSAPDGDSPGLSPEDWNQLDELSNLALEEQVGELLNSEDSEAPWRPSCAPHAVEESESCSVPDTERASEQS